MCRLAAFLWSWDGLKFLVNLGSVVFGILGTWLMSRRYARKFWPNLFFTFLFPALYLIGKGGDVRNFVNVSIKSNEDIKDSATDMTIGLYLLFWTFFLQLIALSIETFK